jgi:hypothetical protein
MRELPALEAGMSSIRELIERNQTMKKLLAVLMLAAAALAGAAHADFAVNAVLSRGKR